MRRPSSFAALALSLVMAPVLAFGAPIDTFEDGTAQGWFFGGGGGAIPRTDATNITTGGPAGLNDNYMELNAIGLNGPNSRLVVNNDAQWSGDYLAAGITSITMDVNNFGPSDLSLRLAFQDLANPLQPNIAFTNAVAVPTGSGWTSIAFSIVPADLTSLVGSVTAALSNTGALRLYHSPTPNAPGLFSAVPAVVARLGVDNIETQNGETPVPPVQAPEPAMSALLAAGLGLMAARARRRAR